MRAARAERGGQDHGRTPADHAAAAGRGFRAGRRARPGPRGRRRPAPDRRHRAVRVGRRGPHRPPEPALVRPAAPAAGRLGAGRRTPRPLRPDGGRGPARLHLLRRHATPPRPGREPGPPSGGAVPGRTDDGTRPGRPEPDLGRRARPQGGGHDRAPHHAVPGGGRPPRRRHRPGGPGTGRAHRVARRTQGTGGGVRGGRRRGYGGHGAGGGGPRPAHRNRTRAGPRPVHRGRGRHRPDADPAAPGARTRHGGRPLLDASLRPPTLDDVFLRLTGENKEVAA